MPKEPRPLHDLHPLRLLPLALCLAMVVFCIIRGGFSVEDILSYAPRNVWLAAGFLLLLYLAKCLSVAFPIIVLQVAAGHLFAPAAALALKFVMGLVCDPVALNVLGLAVDLTVPFWIGRFSGSGLTTRLLARYPRLDGLLESQEGHYLFLSFFLRVIYLLPGDIVSMYFGSVRGPYLTCLLGGLLGGLPSLLAATLLGASVSQPGSPAFWLALGITAGVSVLSLLGYLLWQKRQKNKI